MCQTRSVCLVIRLMGLGRMNNGPGTERWHDKLEDEGEKEKIKCRGRAS